MQETTDVGTCPKCGSEELEYGKEEVNETLDYPFTCKKCGHKDAEMNEVTFIGFRSQA